MEVSGGSAGLRVERGSMGADISRVMWESCSRVWDCSRILWTTTVWDIGSWFWVGLGLMSQVVARVLERQGHGVALCKAQKEGWIVPLQEFDEWKGMWTKLEEKMVKTFEKENCFLQK